MPDKDIAESDVRRCLQGISFPVSRHELVQYAKNHDCLPQVVELFQVLPERDLSGLGDLLEDLHEVQ